MKAGFADRKPKALVTGGSAGLGRALCQALAKAGYAPLSIDRDTPEASPGVTHIACELSNRAALDLAIAGIVSSGPFDLVVFNAGTGATGRFETVPVAAMLALLRVNAEAPMVMLHALEAAHALSPGAVLVFISSLSHFTGYPGAAAYAASKDALAIFAKSVARRFALQGIHVLTVFPGPIRTAHAARHAPTGANPDGRMAPDALAKLILEAAASRRKTLFPGLSAKCTAIAGRLAPGLVTRAMRRILYDHLGDGAW